jgi:hypothetical protein
MNMAGLLHNAAIELPHRVFDVELVVFGTITRQAVKRTVRVLAQTARGARRICRSRYRRIEITGAREVGRVEDMPASELFPDF